jgi:hypothetical protein
MSNAPLVVTKAFREMIGIETVSVRIMRSNGLPIRSRDGIIAMGMVITHEPGSFWEGNFDMRLRRSAWNWLRIMEVAVFIFID